MARGRKRKDPVESPVDGDYRQDVVLDKDPAKRYCFVSTEDLPIMRGRGFVKTERSEGGARPAWDVGEGVETGYQIGGQLMLMEAPEERAIAVQKRGEREFAQSMQGLRAGLNETTETRYGSVGPQPGKFRNQFRVET